MTAGATAADRCSRADHQSGNRRNEAGCWKLDRAGVIDAGDGGKSGTTEDADHKSAAPA
jgi:hypothetical protein